MNSISDYPDASALHHGLLPKRFEAIAANLSALYPQSGELMLDRLVATLSRYQPTMPRGEAAAASGCSERDVVLISYGDSIRRGAGRADAEPPLSVLKRFADDRLRGAISRIHLLPFFPWSSDDGFSVIDYRAVDPALGGWDEIAALGERFGLMFDLVLNHCSSQSAWFGQFATGILPYSRYFMTASPDDDLEAVVRPRTSPLLTAYETRAGTRHVWTTFSADQVDLDWSNPDVFFEFLDIILAYALRGAGIIRLDAVAFLWKEIGTPCIHLPQTHLIIRILRQALDLVAPGTLLLTETNVPHDENVSYFGNGDEAQMVYNFALPPLLLHALLSADGQWLTQWARALSPPPAGCMFLNFTASHDGVGLRPAQGVLPDAEIGRMVERVLAGGGRVATRSLPGGGESPYELNATWFSALADGVAQPGEIERRRFLCSQAIALALAGMPAVYIHSMFGSLNDTAGVEASGSNRAINRAKLDESEVERWLGDESSHHGRVFRAYHELLCRRAGIAALHPEAYQLVHDCGNSLFVVERRSRAGRGLLCAHNLSAGETRFGLAACGWKSRRLVNRLDDAVLEPVGGEIALGAYEFVWLERAGGR